MTTPFLKEAVSSFKANLRAKYSLYFLIVLIVISLFAPLIANDKPLFLYFDGKVYFPIFSPLNEDQIGGDYANPANFNDPFVKDLVHEHGFMVMPPIPFHYTSLRIDLNSPAPTPPDSTSWLGTDDHGRDLLSRVLYGLSISLFFSLILAVLSTFVGIAYGAIQGFTGGITDVLMQRIVEIWSSMPLLYLVIILSGFFDQSFIMLLSIMLLFSWIYIVPVVRAEILKVRNYEYVTAARALGLSEMRILFRHTLPNALTAAVSFVPFIMSIGLTSLTVLDFLGIGLPPGSPSLGELLNEAKENLSAYWILSSVFITLTIIMISMFFIGEGVRDALSSHERR